MNGALDVLEPEASPIGVTFVSAAATLPPASGKIPQTVVTPSSLTSALGQVYSSDGDSHASVGCNKLAISLTPVDKVCQQLPAAGKLDHDETVSYSAFRSALIFDTCQPAPDSFPEIATAEDLDAVSVSESTDAIPTPGNEAVMPMIPVVSDDQDTIRMEGLLQSVHFMKLDVVTQMMMHYLMLPNIFIDCLERLIHGISHTLMPMDEMLH
ncbi:hypothetical protein Nepgr_003950 [Nepenthes gracilis]|uniref:Uncharacterized protein n=1 Tax=Nepenthes gracilis TaxID=150966 RepID=A0AAD3S0F9_NEPGR|nr:hypothetical protein Nepgr_003950 [Nepenthes gracilis]